MSDVLADAQVRIHATLVEAMRSLERSFAQIVLVADELGRIAGTLTDGDIRRALLGGAPLTAGVAPFINRHFVYVGVEADRGEVLDLMQARRVSQVPILDLEGRLVGLHLLNDIIGVSERPNWAVIMAGGKGARLMPLTRSVPKPMLHVAGRPILERLVLHLVGHGIRRIFLAVNYLSETIERHFGDGEKFGCRVEYLHETEPLDTGGPLSLLPETPSAPLVTLNGDLVVQFDLGRMLAFHERGRHALTVATHVYAHTVPFGVVELEGGRVRRLREKPTQSWVTNAGIYVLDPALLGRVPRAMPFPLPALVEQCLARGESVGAFPIEGDWIDVGHPTELSRARGETG